MSIEVGQVGLGAIGSFAAALLPSSVASTAIDAQVVTPENLATSRFDGDECFQPKAVATAARRRAGGAVARAIHGDVRYVLRPGLVRALAALLVAVDNQSAVRDVVEMVWDAGITGMPLFVLTCGNAGTGGGYQVRVFLTGRDRLCTTCLWGDAEREADRRGTGASCAVTTAPRASADAAEAAAAAGVRLLGQWLDGDHSIAGTRVQCVGAAGEYVIRMPERPAARCPVPHHPQIEPVIELDGPVGTVTMAAVAARALAVAGDDAEIHFGRRAIPMLGMSCGRCHVVTSAPIRFLPVAAAMRRCDCESPLIPLATRNRVSARELAASDAAPVTLREFGGAPGDELLAVGSRGAARLRTTFDWKEIA